MQPNTAKELFKLYLAKGAAATTAIEGNTLTEEEVRRRIDGKLDLPPSKEYLGQEIDNIIFACNSMAKAAHAPDFVLTSDLVKSFNRDILRGLALEQGVVPGEIRSHEVVVGKAYKGAPAKDCPVLLEMLCDWLSGKELTSPADGPLKGMDTVYAIIRAILAHIYLAWIHPFGDGNGRTARIVEVLILMTAGVPQPACHLLSNHYNQTRTRYYRCLDEASKSGGDVLPFLEYAVEGFVDGLREQLATIRAQQWNVAWINFVHELFQDKESVTHRRQRHLVLDLSNQKDPVAMADLTSISGRVAKEYASRTTRTLLRDLKELEAMELITRDGDRLRANREHILAFLPWRKEKPLEQSAAAP